MVAMIMVASADLTSRSTPANLTVGSPFFTRFSPVTVILLWPGSISTMKISHLPWPKLRASAGPARPSHPATIAATRDVAMRMSTSLLENSYVR